MQRSLALETMDDPNAPEANWCETGHSIFILAGRISSCARSRLPLWLMPISAMMIIDTFLEIYGGENLAKVAQFRPPGVELQEVLLPAHH